MDSSDSLERLQALHRDLVIFSESRVANFDRLVDELEASIVDFRKLLDRQKKNSSSRQAVSSDPAKVGNVEYTVTDEFKQIVIEVSDELDLDEQETFQLCYRMQEQGHTDSQSIFSASVVYFHEQRRTLLECLRLSLRQAVDTDPEDQSHEVFTALARLVAQGEEQQPTKSAEYWQKCIGHLGEIEQWLARLQQRSERLVITGQSLVGPLAEALRYQCVSLTDQHASLGAIMALLVQANHTTSDDFRALLKKATDVESFGNILINYIPPLLTSAAEVGADGSTPLEVARGINKYLTIELQWKSKTLRSATIVWWLAEYSSRYADPSAAASLPPGLTLSKDAETRYSTFVEAVGDGAFEIMLSVCNTLKPEIWHDPAKVGLLRHLLEHTSDGPGLPDGSPPPPDFLAELVMQRLQTFSEAFIVNTPDALRLLKNEEDVQRRNRGIQGNDQYRPDLDRLILVMAYAFDDPLQAAEDFWTDKDGNMYGFLRWISTHMPTPRVAAFCELLCALSSNEACAVKAHQFLQEENISVPGRTRRLTTLSWAQIFSEMDTFLDVIKDQAVRHNSSALDPELPQGTLVEPESLVMLETYLRLTAHLCRTSIVIRDWILKEAPFRLVEVLFQFARSGIESRLRASVFKTLTSLLTNKSAETGERMWLILDEWITKGGPAGYATTSDAPTQSVLSWADKHMMQTIADQNEEGAAFVGFLGALIEPAATQTELTDSLPFPERMGLAHQHSGIDLYVDTVLGRAFARTAHELEEDGTLLQVLRFECLSFAATCLSTFNEDLVLLANSTCIAVDTAMASTNLETYVLLHPFARVMEWMFNEKVILALFASIEQNVAAVSNAVFEAPLVQATLKAMQVIDLIMHMQATYFNIVRPIVKTKSASRSAIVADATLVSFDEAILAQLEVVRYLGAYCASSHQAVQLVSLRLLTKLAKSRRFSGAASTFGQMGRGNQLLGILQDESADIAGVLSRSFRIKSVELESGDPPLKLATTNGVLYLLSACLERSADTPTLAHSLLGFDCGERTIQVREDSAFARGSSLFHALVELAATLPDSVESTKLSWLLHTKLACMVVVRRLVRSPLSAPIATIELRSMDFLNVQMLSLAPVTAATLWDNHSSQDPLMLLDSPSLALHDFLLVHASTLEYAATEFKHAAETGSQSVRTKVIGALLGTVRFPSGEEQSCLSVFDLFEMFEIEIPQPLQVSLKLLQGLDLTTCMKDDDEISDAFDLKLVQELLTLRCRELKASGTIKDPADLTNFEEETTAILESLRSRDQSLRIAHARETAVAAWMQLMTLMLLGNGFDSADRLAFALRALELVLPKFDHSVSNDIAAALQLVKLVQNIVGVLIQGPQMSYTSKTRSEQAANTTNERLLQTFRICINAVAAGDNGIALREVCYQTCSDIIHANANLSSDMSPTLRQCYSVLQSAGERVMTVVCEDGLSGMGSARVSALLFLDAAVLICQRAKSTAALRSVHRMNFIAVLVDSIGGIIAEFQSRSGQDLLTLLSYFHTGTSLLLRVSQTQDGATMVLNAGLFAAVSDSQLFTTDPDIGLDIDNPIALIQFYRLIASVLDVITAVVLTKGPKNQQTGAQAKQFLRDSRSSMQAVFKRASALEKTAGPPEREVYELVDGFSALICACGFLEDDEAARQRSARPLTFS